MTPGWWLYLLECRDGRTYAGIATDVAARFAAHSRGKGAKFTRSNRNRSGITSCAVAGQVMGGRLGIRSI
jgi:predicted GIY-YIG superfamily endonuclease